MWIEQRRTVINRLLRSSHLRVELVIATLRFRQYQLSGRGTAENEATHVVDSGNAERKASWDLDTEGKLAILAVGRDADAGADFSVILAEGDSDGALFR